LSFKRSYNYARIGVSDEVTNIIELNIFQAV